MSEDNKDPSREGRTVRKNQDHGARQKLDQEREEEQDEASREPAGASEESGSPPLGEDAGESGVVDDLQEPGAEVEEAGLEDGEDDEVEFDLEAQIEAFRQQIEEEPDNCVHHYNLGEALAELGQTGEARTEFERALELDQEETHTLNNLAWLLTEIHNNDEKRLQESVTLAQQALALKQAAFIWDTLAEAYLTNGEYELAADAARQALKLAKEKMVLTRDIDLNYYRERLEKLTVE